MAAWLLVEAGPAGLVPSHALSGTEDFPISVIIYLNRHQNCHILELSTPVTPQVNPIHIDIEIPSALRGPATPILNIKISIFGQFTDVAGDILLPNSASTISSTLL